MKRGVKNFVLVGIIALVLHGIWEYAQCGIFYTMDGTASFEHTKLMVSATIGDMNITFGLFFILIFATKDPDWLRKKWDRNFWVISILYGLFISFYFETHALYHNRWGYSGQMPLFPGTNIGLLPVIQLLILLPFSFYLAKLMAKKLEIYNIS